MSRRALALGGLLLAACTGTVEVADVPAEVDWVGMVRTGEAGQVRAATGLARLEPDGAVPFYAHPEPDRWVIGYGGDTFAAAAARVSEVAMAQAGLRDADGCGPALPTPDWWLSFTQDGLPVPFAVDEAPALTADWVEDACDATTDLDYAVEFGCLPSACLIRADVGRACTAALDLSACGLGTVPLKRSPFTVEACLDTPPEWGCEPRPNPPREAVSAHSCVLPLEDGPRACDVTVYVRSETRPHPLDGAAVERLELVADSDVGPSSSLVRFGLISPEDTLRGVAWGMVPTEDGSVWVSRYADGGAGFDCKAPAGRPATELVKVDGDRLEVVATATAPPCLQALIVDPDPGPGVLLGAHAGPGDSWMVSRFDADGRVIAQVTLPDAAPVEDYWFAGLVAFPGLGTVTAVVSSEDPEDIVTMIGLRLDDLSVIDSKSVDFGVTHRVAPGVEGEILAGVKGDERYFTVIGTDGNGNREVFERPAVRDNMSFMDVLRHAGTGHRVFAVSRDMTSVQVWSRRGVDAANFYERPSQAARLAIWPPDASRLAVLSVTRGDDGDFPALLHLVDPDRPTLAPGARRIGEGVPVEMTAGPRGRLWVLMAWSGALIRVTP